MKNLGIMIFSFLLPFLPGIAFGTDGPQTTLRDFLSDTKVDGRIRLYYFNRFYQGVEINQQAFSLGGNINVHTPSLFGFSADVDFYTANSMGLNPSDIRRLDLVLMGKKAPSMCWDKAISSTRFPTLFECASVIS